jgi:hypothetical protein
MDSQRKLQEHYARLNDGEIEAIAREAFDLTEVARSLLLDEIVRRGLKISLATGRGEEPKPLPPPNPADQVEAGVYYNAEDARTVVEYLREYHIGCFWGTDRATNPDGLDFTDGVDLFVRHEDFASASEALRQLFTRFKPQAPEWNQEQVCACPKCRSEEIVLLEVDGHEAAKAPGKFHWICDACGHVWEDEGVSVVRDF